MHQLQSGQVPSISPSLLMYQQISIYGFNLAQWTTEHGKEAYLQMLRTLAELVLADRLNIFTKTLPVEELNSETLKRALASHRAKQDSKTFRERTVLVFGDEAGANDMYFDLAAKIRKIEFGEADYMAEPEEPIRAMPVGGAGGQASKRWANAQELLKYLELEEYIDAFVEEEMTSIQVGNPPSLSHGAFLTGYHTLATAAGGDRWACRW